MLKNWPIVEGRFVVGNKENCVAVCTNASIDEIELDLSKISIIGKCVTENIGIEKIIQNTISNPFIRFLLLCGSPSKGHFVGQAFLALKQNGVDKNKRIIGAKGNMPVLKNLSFEEIERFRLQVQPINLIGEKNPEKIMQKIEELNKLNPGKFEGKPVELKQVKEVIAVKDKKFVPDPKGYFVIYLNKEKNQIIVEHYFNGFLDAKIVGQENEALRDSIAKLNLFGDFESKQQHLMYLGKELFKAELALKHGLNYEQDAELNLGKIDSITNLKKTEKKQKALDEFEWHD